MNNRLQNKIALVTGAASGIGKAIAQLFAEEGAIVWVADIDAKRGQRVVDIITRKQGQACFLPLDVAQENQWQQAFQSIKNQHQQLNILVNNAGILLSKPIPAMNLADWQKIMQINTDSVFLGTKYAMSMMQHNPGSSIINMSSTLGLFGNHGVSAYCASKGAIRLFTKAAAIECAALTPHPIRVNSIHPGGVETPIWGKTELSDEFVQTMGGEGAAFDSLASTTPLNRFAYPEEIARAALFLASDESHYITGTELVIDGGFMAQ